MMKIKNADLGLLVLRLVLGAIFLSYGSAKFSMMAATVAFFASLGFPAIVAYIVAAIEVLGGVALILGLWVDVAGILLAIVMLVAIFTVTSAKGFMGGWDFNLILLAGSLCAALAGAGKYALKRS